MDENSKLRNENIELEKKLNEVISKLEGQIVGLKEENVRLKEQIKASNERNTQTAADPAFDNSKMQQMKKSDKEEFKDLDAQMEAEKINLSAKKNHFVPNWWIEVLAWIKRIEMADCALSHSSQLFKCLCWPKLHGNVKPHIVKRLEFDVEYDNEVKGIRLAKLELKDKKIPIARIAPPKYIIGFKKITINFFDGTVMQFIELFKPFLNDLELDFDIKLPFCSYTAERIAQIHRLFTMLASKTNLFYSKNLFEIPRFYPNANSIIENVESIMASPLETDIPLLVQWLNKPLADERPKSFFFHIQKGRSKFILVDKIVKQFSVSTKPANFIVRLNSFPDCRNFQIKNEQTGEMLVLYPNENEGIRGRQFLIRHPQGKEYLRENWKENFINNKLPYICVDIKQIGVF